MGIEYFSAERSEYGIVNFSNKIPCSVRQKGRELIRMIIDHCN